MNKSERASFSGRLGFVLSAAGAAVGLGNIWRFPYLAAKYGGGAFLLVYLILVATFGYTMIIAESTIGRSSGKSPVSAFRHFSDSKAMNAGGWLNAIIPILIVPYYSVIGGWVCKYLYSFLTVDMKTVSSDSFFGDFISDGVSTEVWFIVFTVMVMAVILAGVNNGIERVTRFMMPGLFILAVIICIYGIRLPGALKGVKYFLIPNLKNFSWMTIVSAMGQMFYSLSIAMGILITFGSYMSKETSIDESARQVELFDTIIAILAGLMIIPAVFSFSKGDPEVLKAGPSLMFVMMPKVFAGMGGGRLIGILFFVLVLFAALTSAIALTECVVSTFYDEFGWSRRKGTLVTAFVMIMLGTLSCQGYGPLASVKILGMQFLDFFDFMTNSVMMPVSALAICILVSRYMGLDMIKDEVTAGGKPFQRRRVFNFMIRFVCPVFVVIIFLSSVAGAFGLIHF